MGLVACVFAVWKTLQPQNKKPARKRVASAAIVPSSTMHPLKVFRSWMKEYEALASSPITAKFACLSTVSTSTGHMISGIRPNARMVSILDITDDFQFMFGTVLTSNKVKEMRLNPNVSLTFNYNEPRTSIRIHGVVEQCDEETSTKYWNSRGRGYKIAMMTTTQTEEIQDIKEFEDRIDATTRSMDGKDIPLPIEQWAAFAITPIEVEFWRYGSNNCHLRHLYQKSGDHDSWDCVMLDG